MEDINTIINQSTLVFILWINGSCQSCGPMIRAFNEFSKIRRSRFLILDTDDYTDLAISHNITSVPTLVVYNNGSIIQTVTNINPDKLKNIVNKLV